MSRTLFLHIGQTKTGTTHLQSLLTANRGALAAVGVSYPVYGDDAREIDLRRMVPCGNGRTVLDDEAAFRAALQVAGDAERVLFSSEIMYKLIYERAAMTWLPGAAREHGFDDVRVLCLLRDPLSFAVSDWQQRVKGSQGETRTLDDYVATAFDGPGDALVALRRLEALAPAVSSTVWRYETVRGWPGGLDAAVAGWLDVPAETFAVRPTQRVNRSLTRSETELQRQLNLRLGRSGDLFGFRLTVDAPDVEADAPVIGPDAVRAAVERLAPVVAEVNARLDPDHALALEPATSGHQAVDRSAERYSFGSDQLSVLADGIAEHLETTRRDSQPRAVVRRGVRGVARRLRRGARRLR